jgi:hypothetical protein
MVAPQCWPPRSSRNVLRNCFRVPAGTRWTLNNTMDTADRSITRLLFLVGYAMRSKAWQPETVPVAEAADLIR